MSPAPVLSVTAALDGYRVALVGRTDAGTINRMEVLGTFRTSVEAWEALQEAQRLSAFPFPVRTEA